MLTGQSAGGVFSTKRIEDLAEGDMVLTRAEDDPSAGLELRPVQRVFRSLKYELTAVEVLLADGTQERILTTGQHPFWVEGQGWTEAQLLLAGQRLTTADGREVMVLGVTKQAHPEGLIVYNIQVEGGHTYFVDDGLGDIAAIWVHNKRKKISSWGRWLKKQRGEGPPADMVNAHAHHIVYKGKFSGSPEMRKVLKESRTILREGGINFRTGVENVHWAPNRGHSIANAKKVLEELREVRGQGKKAVAGVLQSIADRLKDGTF